MNISTVAKTAPIVKMRNIGLTASIETLVHSVLSSCTLIGHALLLMRFRIPVLRRRSNLGQKIMFGSPQYVTKVALIYYYQPSHYGVLRRLRLPVTGTPSTVSKYVNLQRKNLV